MNEFVAHNASLENTDGDHSIVVFYLVSLFTLVIFSPTSVAMGNFLVHEPIKGQVRKLNREFS